MSEKCLMLVTGIDYSGGGIARSNRLVRRALMDYGFEIDVLALSERMPAYGDTRSSSGSYTGFNHRKIPFTAAAWRRLLSAHYALVICDHINLAAMLAPLNRAGRCSYITWLYGNEVFPPKPDFEGRLGMLHAMKCLAITAFTQEQVSGRFPGLQVEICELALDPDFYGESLPEQPVSRVDTISLPALDGKTTQLGRQMILFVGRIDTGSRYKGQSLLLQAFPGLQAGFPQAQLVIAGAGDDLPALRTQAAQLPPELHGRIFIPGFVPQERLQALYHACSLFAMPSTGEGFGLVYLEAMAAARPCLAYRESAARVLIQDGVNGLLVNQVDSVQEVGEKIKKLLAEPELACELGRAGYRLVRERYLYPHFRERFSAALGLNN